MMLAFTVSFFFVLADFADTLQVFSEEFNSTLRCPPFTSVGLEMYLVFQNTENKMFTCYNKTTPCTIVGKENSVEFNNSGSYFTINLSSLTLKRSLRVVTCVFNDGEKKSNYTDDVSFIAKAEGVKCYDTKLTNNNKNISVSCMTSKIYPEAHCNFGVYGHVSYQHFQYSNTVDYYQSNCTWTSSLNNFQIGNNTLDVSFYPNITNDTNFATNLMLSFQFSLPNILLSNECFNSSNIVHGYIKPGVTAVCVCYIDNIGYPPASLKWTNSSNLNLGTFLNNSATSLTIEPFSSKETYNCTLSTNLFNGGLSIPYKINYAEGPTSCSIELKNTSQAIWKICKNTFIIWTIICQVNQTDAIPGIKAKIGVNKQYSILLDSQNFANFYQVRNEINVTEAGDYSIGCQVQNLYFPDVKVECSYTPLQVMAPPILSPIIQIQSTDHDTVIENKVYNLECSAYGGKPNVFNFTLSCGNIELTQHGNILKSAVTFTRNMTGQNCTCTAQHITGCYENNTSTLKLNILYTAAIVYLNVTSSVIEKGNYAQLYCKADGNPEPNISIVKDNEIIAQNSSGYILFLNKSMSCKDGGNYICQANNGIDLNIYKKQVILFVRCPLQFSSDNNLKNFSLQEGNTFFYNFTIYGYPDPDKFTISKFNQGKNNVEVTMSSLETPFLSIELKIARLTHTDFDNYTLFLFQNGSQPLLFKFSISEADEEKGFSAVAIGVGISTGCLIIFCVILFTYIYRNGKCIVQEKSYY
ncbi:hypothetical protein Bpfe_001355, partial [Biomphalaria pfeifferi]